MLGAALSHFFADEREAVARILKTTTGPAYILQRLQGRDRIESNHVELVARCIYIQECVLPDRNLVGIAATDDFGTLSPDAVILLCYLEGAVGTEAMRERAETLARDLRLFQQIRTLDVPSDELGLPPTKR